MPMDGTAISLGMVGTSKVINIEGSAVSMAGARSTLVIPIRSFDGEPISNNSMLVTSLSGNNVISYKPADVLVTLPKKTKALPSFIGKTVTSNDSVDIVLRSKTVQVSDISDTSKKILGLLSLYPFNIKDKGAFVADQCQYKINIFDPRIKISAASPKKPPLTISGNAKVTVEDMPTGRIVINPAITFVEKRVQKANNSTILKPVSINVDDYRPPTGGATTGAGGLKLIKISAQMYSYFEHSLYFNEGNVISITGLPQGVFCESGTIKGSPTVSGNYPITIKLDNKVSIPGILKVPQLQRQF